MVGGFKEKLKFYIKRRLYFKKFKNFLKKKPSKLKGDNNSYNKFIILGSNPRCGSTIINYFLEDHPQVLAMFEAMINPPYGNANDTIKIKKERDFLREIFPIKYIDEYLFGSYKEHFKAVGFKLFPEHLNRKGLRFNPLQNVWDWLYNNKDIKIIYIYRENMLRSYVSDRLASKTKIWNIKDINNRPNEKIKINIDHCKRRMKEIEKNNEYIENVLKGHQVLKIKYEDLIQNKSKYLKEIQSFLDVYEYDISPRTYKKEIRRLEDIIENYEEVKTLMHQINKQNYLDDQDN